MLHEIKGNLLDSDCHFICHQVNCQGKMNSGVAKSIREKWPIVYAQYRDWYIGYEAWAHAHDTYPGMAMLGSIQTVFVGNCQHVINMAAQNNYGYDSKRYTSYDAFWMCLGEIKETVRKGDTIAFPKNIGCCRGGANWAVIRTMIEEVLGNEYEVYIYEYDGD